MEILDSIEVRWFFTEDHPALAAAQPWFADAPEQPPRTDHYLATERDDLGIKGRMVEGQPTKVETKYLLDSLGELALHAQVTGRVERWRKLSLALGDDSLATQGHWHAVRKRRRLRTFRVEGKTASEIAMGERVAAGCGLELTEVQVVRGGHVVESAWTIGLEAFGEGDPPADLLRAAYDAARSSGLSLQLTAAESMGYPAWLCRRGL